MTQEVDVWSFGTLLWEMCAGKRAWDTLTYHQVLHALISEGQTLPLKSLSGLPQTLQVREEGGEEGDDRAGPRPRPLSLPYIVSDTGSHERACQGETARLGSDLLAPSPSRFLFSHTHTPPANTHPHARSPKPPLPHHPRSCAFRS